METKQTTTYDFNSFNRFKEKKIDVNDLCFLTKFTKVSDNSFKENDFSKIILNFGFKIINFDKKRMAPFLFVLEILSTQRNIAVKAKKTIFTFNIKKNTFVGCKITLRKNSIFSFMDTLILYLPQLEKLNSLSIKNVKQNKFNNFSFWLIQLFRFYPLKNLQQDFIQKLQLIFIFKNWFFEEKIFLLTSNNLPINN